MHDAQRKLAAVAEEVAAKCKEAAGLLRAANERFTGSKKLMDDATAECSELESAFSKIMSKWAPVSETTQHGSPTPAPVEHRRAVQELECTMVTRIEMLRRLSTDLQDEIASILSDASQQLDVHEAEQQHAKHAREDLLPHHHSRSVRRRD